MSREPRAGWSRRAVLAAALASAAAPAAGCAWSPVRLEGTVAIPRPPALSPAEAARTVVAGGARAAARSLTEIDAGLLPADTPGRITAWVEIHRAHLISLADTASSNFPAGRPVAVPGALGLADPVRALAGVLQAVAGGAVRAAVTVPDAAPLYCRIAAARAAQDRQLRSAAGLPVAAVSWPDATPTDVLQLVLAAEHAVVDGYTTAAAWDSERRDRLVAAAVRHEDSRDALAALIVAGGAAPVTAAPGYAVPAEAAPGAGTPAERATVLAVAVESGLARAAIEAATTFLSRPQSERAEVDAVAVAAAGAGAAAEAEVARQSWGAAPEPLPGS